MMSAVYYEQSKDNKDKRKVVRYFNWKLAAVLIISFFVLGVGAFALRQWHKNNRTQQGLILGSKAYEEGRWEDAAEYLGRYLAVRRDDVDVLLKYADAHQNIRPTKRNNYQQAVGAYRTILRIDKNNSEAVTRLINIYLWYGAGEAELIARRQLETNPDPMLKRLLAQAMINQRKYPEAISLLEDVIEEHPDQIYAYQMLGVLVEQRPEDFLDVQAVDWFDRAVNNNPSSALAYITRAAFYRRNGNVPRALTNLEQAQGKDLSDADVRLRLAEELIYCGDLKRAKSHLEAVREVIPRNSRLWNVWAQYAFRSKSKEIMQKVAEDGLEALSSQPWDFMHVAAELYIQCDRFEDANTYITKLSEKDIVPARVAFLRGSVANRQGRVREAVQFWRQSIESGNKSPQVRLALASALSNLGDGQSAMRQLRTLISESPNWSQAHLALARQLSRFGNWTETARHARRAGELQPGHTEAVLLYLKAQIRLLRQNTADSDVGYQESIKAIETQLSALKKNLGTSHGVQSLEFEFALLRGKFDDARRLMDQLKQTSKAPEDIILNEVSLLAAQDKMDQALQRLEDALQNHPKSENLARSFAILSDRQGHRKKCEETLKRALTSIEEPFSQRQLGLLLALFYTRWEQEDDAYTLLLTLSQKLPEDIPIKRRLLSFERVLKDTEQAQELVDQIKTLEGEDGWQWRYEQAKLWFDGDQFESRHPEIVSLLQQNMLVNPNDQASRILLGQSHERAGDLQLAISMYREALRMTPNDLRVIVPMLAALYKAKGYDEAEDIMNRASRLKLSHPQLLKWEYMDYMRRGELNSASVILQDFIRNDPNNQAACLNLALLKIQQNEFEEALELLDEQKRRDPDSIPITEMQIQISLRRNDPEEALRLSNEMVQKLNKTSAYLLRARTYSALGQVDRAIEDLQQAIEMDPDNVQVWMAKSALYRSLGRMDMAIADVQKALSLAPDNIHIQKQAISLFFASGKSDDIDKGEILLEKALESNIEDIELRLFKARSLISKGTEKAMKEADRILERITDERPEISEAWRYKGEIAIKRGLSPRAIDVALSGLTYQSNNKGLLLLKARAEAMRSPVLAISTLKGLHEMDPNDSSVAGFLANTYIEAGEPDKAVDLLTDQLKRCEDSNRRQCRISLAFALYKKGDTDLAIKELDSLLQAEPGDPYPLLAKAQLLREDRLWSELDREVISWYEKHPEGSRTLVAIATDMIEYSDNQARSTAEKILSAVRKEDPNCIEAMDVLAVLLLDTPGRAGESEALYRRILELDPDHYIAMNNLAWILSEEQNKPQEALEFAQKGLQINPEFNELFDTRGVIYYRLGEYEKAVEDFNMAIQLYSSTAQHGVNTRLYLGRTYAKLEIPGKAIEYLEQSLDLNSRIGGLTPTDVEEARRLIKQLQEGR